MPEILIFFKSVHLYKARAQMLTETELHEFIETLIQYIESLEDNYPDCPDLYKLKLLLSDNVSEGEIHIRPSLQNKGAHLLFLNCMDYMYKFEKENLSN
jgi:hypothetical protein